MRIACVYLPSFPLQAHVRQAPHRAGTAMVIIEPRPTGSVVLACSRAAWTSGVRPQMTVSRARSLCADLVVFTGDGELYRGVMDALLDSLAACSDHVDGGADLDAISQHRAIYLRVPPRSRGASFGQKLLAQLTRQGLRGRVGVADDRFTAYVAAVRTRHRGRDSRLDDPDRQPPLFHQSCTVVPRGGSAAFLAPLPLAHLPIDRDIKHLLETCGVKTLGDFADLPPPSVARERVSPQHDYQALARGQGPARVAASDRDALCARPLSERLELESAAADAAALSFVLRTVCERVSHRLSGRGRAAAAVELYLHSSLERDGQASAALPVVLERPAATGGALVEALGGALARLSITDEIAAVEVAVVHDVEPGGVELDLFAATAERGRSAATGQGAQRRFGRTAPIAHHHERPAQSPRRRPRQQVLRLFD